MMLPYLQSLRACSDICVNLHYRTKVFAVFVLINRDKLARRVLEGEITSLDDLKSVLRSMIKGVVVTRRPSMDQSILRWSQKNGQSVKL